MFDFAFNSLNEAIYMNGHGIFVWSVLVIVILSFLIFFFAYRYKIKQIKKKLNGKKISLCMIKKITLMIVFLLRHAMGSKYP